MLILDKQRAIERIVALSDAQSHSALGVEPPKGARPRVAAYRPKRPRTADVAERVEGATAPRRVRRGTGAAFPV
jgi:hypothetical protein